MHSMSAALEVNDAAFSDVRNRAKREKICVIIARIAACATNLLALLWLLFSILSLISAMTNMGEKVEVFGVNYSVFCGLSIACMALLLFFVVRFAVIFGRSRMQVVPAATGIYLFNLLLCSLLLRLTIGFFALPFYTVIRMDIFLFLCLFFLLLQGAAMLLARGFLNGKMPLLFAAIGSGLVCLLFFVRAGNFVSYRVISLSGGDSFTFDISAVRPDQVLTLLRQSTDFAGENLSIQTLKVLVALGVLVIVELIIFLLCYRRRKKPLLIKVFLLAAVFVAALTLLIQPFKEGEIDLTRAAGVVLNKTMGLNDSQVSSVMDIGKIMMNPSEMLDQLQDYADRVGIDQMGNGVGSTGGLMNMFSDSIAGWSGKLNGEETFGPMDGDDFDGTEEETVPEEETEAAKPIGPQEIIPGSPNSTFIYAHNDILTGKVGEVSTWSLVLILIALFCSCLLPLLSLSLLTFFCFVLTSETADQYRWFYRLRNGSVVLLLLTVLDVVAAACMGTVLQTEQYLVVVSGKWISIGISLLLELLLVAVSILPWRLKRRELLSSAAEMENANAIGVPERGGV